MTYQAKNNAFSTLAGALTNVATSLTVQTGHGDRFPVIASPHYTVITLEDASGNREVVKVTARAGAADAMTIVRGQEGTTARAWAAGDSVELRMTAGEVQPLFDHVDDPLAAHAASAISNTPAGNLAASDVQAALNELQTDVDTREFSIDAATAKTTPVDADLFGLIDSAASFVLKKITLSNLKAFLFGSAALTGTPTAPTATAGTNTTQIATTKFVLANGGFPAGTRMPFAMASAPTGWTQDTSDNATNRMLRVVNTTGNGVGGSHSPILNNVVPAHTHGFTTGNMSADHSHGIGDPGHAHSYTTVGSSYAQYSTTGRSTDAAAATTGAAGTGIWAGGVSANHTHSGSTDNGSSQTNWTPRYIDMIICAKN